MKMKLMKAFYGNFYDGEWTHIILGFRGCGLGGDHISFDDVASVLEGCFEAVKAMVLNGLGFINQALYLVPKFFHNKPTYHLFSRPLSAEQLNDDALGRALDTLYTHGMTELYSLIAAHAADRLGLALGCRKWLSGIL